MSRTVLQLIRDDPGGLGLQLLAGESGAGRLIRVAEVHRPALALTGHMEGFGEHQVQVLGETEISYLTSLDGPARRRRLEEYFELPFPCLCVADGLDPVEELIVMAEEKGVPCLSTRGATIDLIRAISLYLEGIFHASTIVQAALMDVGGLGTLILGEPGVGKSETALELVARGHRLVADDVVEIWRTGGGGVIGRSPSLIEHHMEIRGLGIVDVRKLFGARSIRDEVDVELVIELLHWTHAPTVDRTGLDEEQFELLGVRLPRKTIPVTPGRNLAVVIEVACLNERLKKMGIHAAREFDDKVRMEIAKKEGARG